jgi:hypothetical protein
MSAAPDWAAIFKRHPELTPPGYLEACLDMAERRGQRPARGKSRGKKRKEPRLPSLKHGANP